MEYDVDVVMERELSKLKDCFKNSLKNFAPEDTPTFAMKAEEFMRRQFNILYDKYFG
jgi:hypothetical protein